MSFFLFLTWCITSCFILFRMFRSVCWLWMAVAAIIPALSVVVVAATSQPTEADRKFFCSVANLKEEDCPIPKFNTNGLLCGDIKEVRQHSKKICTFSQKWIVLWNASCFKNNLKQIYFYRFAATKKWNGLRRVCGDLGVLPLFKAGIWSRRRRWDSTNSSSNTNYNNDSNNNNNNSCKWIY